MSTTPDDQALDRLLGARPAWSGVERAGDAIGLDGRTLLHCGPPAMPPGALVTPTLNSAAVACVYEGWADTLDEARALIARGGVRFEAAQDHHVATPLAAVVSPSMQVIVMADSSDPSRRAFAPFNGGGTGGDPAPRYGFANEGAVTLLRFLNDTLAPAVAPACAEPIEWLPIIDQALCEGDDAHLHHVAAHAQMMTLFETRLGDAFQGTEPGEFVARWPFFHLNFWMAAVRCALDAAVGVEGSSLVTHMGGNGAQFGLQLSGLPGRWFTAPAEVPHGQVREPFSRADCTGAYGDSALVEAFGLGALAQSYCPRMQALHAAYNPADILDLPGRLLARTHPAMPRSKARVGLLAATVVRTGTTPVVELGLVHAGGEAGGLGAGLYRPPLGPFEAALAAL